MRIGNGPEAVLFVGGLHAGFAPSSVSLAAEAAGHFGNQPQLVPETHTLFIVVSLNPDSTYSPGATAGRLNARGVDLNRNWDCNWRRDAYIGEHIVPGSGGPEPFSEPETVALRDFIWSENIRAVIFWQAQAPNGLVSPGGCNTVTDVSHSLAAAYGLAAGYPVVNFEEMTKQIITGDASNWLDSQGIPAIFVLMPSYTSVDWEDNLAGILAVLERTWP